GDRARKKPKAPTLNPNDQIKGAWVFEIRGYTYYTRKDLGTDVFIQQAVIANLQRADFFVQERQPDKVGKYVPGVDDPLREKDLASDPEGKTNRSRLSHAFIYNVWGQYAPQPGVFLYINQSYLDPLVSGQETNQGYGSPVGPGPGRPPGPGSAPPTVEGGQPGATGPQALGPMWTPP